MNDVGVIPEHMDRWSRNQRLYETLKGMGLFVIPIPDAQNPTKIDRIVVAADLPRNEGCEDTAEASVPRAVERPLVGVDIEAAKCSGSNVVDFPAVV